MWEDGENGRRGQKAVVITYVQPSPSLDEASTMPAAAAASASRARRHSIERTHAGHGGS